MAKSGSILARLSKLESTIDQALNIIAAEGTGISLVRSDRGVVVAGSRSRSDEDPVPGFKGEYNPNESYLPDEMVALGSNEMQVAERRTLYSAGEAAGLYRAKQLVPPNHQPTGSEDDVYWEQMAPFSGAGIGFKDPSQTNKVQIIVVHIPEGYGDAKFRKMDICLDDEDHDAYVLMTQAKRKSDGVLREPTSP